MRKHEIYTYTIPTMFLSTIFNADSSGLEDSNIEAWDKFESVINDTYEDYTWDMPADNAEGGFYKYNDVFGWLGCDCIELKLYVWL